MRKTIISVLIIILLSVLISCDLFIRKQPEPQSWPDSFYYVNDNIPSFTDEERNRASLGAFIELSELDGLGRVGVAIACFDYAHMPTEDRTALNTKPTGWVQKKYDSSVVEGGWLYNRSHILGFQLSGLNDEPRNLMTGTRAFNAGKNSMVTFENMVADHIKEHRDHYVLYRVTPDFEGPNLLAYGVYMESDCIQCDDNAYISAISRKASQLIMQQVTAGSAGMLLIRMSLSLKRMRHMCLIQGH
ncbi:MAG: DNA/RNA non-specific endonuclease [Bullifex sp.]